MSLFTTILPSLTRAPGAETGSANGTASPAVIKPTYDIQQNDDAYQVTVQLPGVGKDDLEVTAEGGEIRITGRRSWKQPEGWTTVYRETPNDSYELVLTHEDAIDSEKIAAELRDGVLQVTLPKREAIKPRKIAIA